MYRKTLRVLLTSATILALAAGAAQAQAQSKTSTQSSSDNFPRFSIGANIGAAASPNAGTFDLGFEAPIDFTRHFSLGPWLQVGMADDVTALLVSANARYSFDVFEGAKLRKLRPYMQGGLGIAYAKPKNVDGETEFLINMGFGAEYEVSDSVFVGSDVMLNTIPTTSTQNAFVLSWQFARIRYRF
jgi:opacity protein-like surface antigen